MVFCVVDEAEWSHRAGFHSEIFHKSSLGCKTEFALVKLFFDVVNVHVLVAVENHKIVSVAFVVSEKQILAMFCIVAGPILFGDLNSGCFGVLKVLEFYTKLV